MTRKLYAIHRKPGRDGQHPPAVFVVARGIKEALGAVSFDDIQAVQFQAEERRKGWDGPASALVFEPGVLEK